MKTRLCLAALTGQFQPHPERARGGRAGPALRAWLVHFQTGLWAQGRASAGAHLREQKNSTEDVPESGTMLGAQGAGE